MLYSARMEDHCRVGPPDLAMKGESIPGRGVWHGVRHRRCARTPRPADRHTRMAMTWRPGPLAGSLPALVGVPALPRRLVPGISSLGTGARPKTGEAGLLMVMRPQEWSAAGTAAWAQRQRMGG